MPNWALNVTMSVVVCGLWGGLLYIGNLETLWRMLGIANQLLATIALAVGTTYLLRKATKRVYAVCTAVPLAFVIVTVFAAGLQSINMWWNKPEAVPLNLFLLKLASVLAAIMLTLTAVIAVDALRCWYGILFGARRKETTPQLEPAPESAP